MSSRAVAAGVLRRHRGGIALGTLMLGVHQVCEAAVPVLVGVVIDEAIAPGDVTALLLLLGVLALLFATLANAYSVGAYVSERAEQRAEHELRLQVVDRVLHPCGGASENRLTGDLAAVAGIDATRAAAVAWEIPVGTSAVLGAVAGGAFLLDRSLVLGAIVLGGLPLLLLLVERLGRPLARSVAREQAGIAAAGGVAADLVAGLRPLKGIGGEAAGDARYRLASRDARAAAIRAARAEAAYEGALQLCTGALLVVVAFVGGRLAAEGSLSLGDLIAALGLTQFLVGPLARLGDVGSELARSRASGRRVAAALAAPYAIRDDGDAAVPPGPGGLVLRGVAYRGLDAVSATVAPGELLGVATPDPEHGEALVRLLARDADPERGTIELDGAALATLDPQALRAELLVAEHDAALFDGSLREVVLGARGRPQALAGALAAAAADEVVASVEGGLDGRVSERGRSLSGGQRQRVALARALCAEPRVLVLHEPTTAVDAATEVRIAAALRDARRGATTIVVTTSPALLAVADRVLMLDGGVVAEGRHDRLVAGEERYRAAVLA